MSEDNEDYINFGDVARGQLHQQCQYACRYLFETDGYAYFGEGIRTIGSAKDYHSIKIHKDDVQKFVQRVLDHRNN